MSRQATCVTIAHHYVLHNKPDVDCRRIHCSILIWQKYKIPLFRSAIQICKAQPFGRFCDTQNHPSPLCFGARGRCRCWFCMRPHQHATLRTNDAANGIRLPIAQRGMWEQCVLIDDKVCVYTHTHIQTERHTYMHTYSTCMCAHVQVCTYFENACAIKQHHAANALWEATILVINRSGDLAIVAHHTTPTFPPSTTAASITRRQKVTRRTEIAPTNALPHCEQKIWIRTTLINYILF